MSFTRLMVRATGVAMAASMLAGPAFAAVTIDARNTNTGPLSNNQNSVVINNSSNKTVNNTATATNVITVVANTGNNKQNKNTKAGSMQTGDVSTNTTIKNKLN